MQEQISIWVNACKNNNRQAQGEIYKLFSPKMYAICLRYSNCEDDAKDLLQESFILAFDKIKSFQEKGSFEGWLRRLTTNVCLDKLRKKTFFVVADETLEAIEEDDASIIEEENMQYQEIVALLKQMPNSYKAIFNLYIIEEYSHQEIANQLNISVGTSKSNLSRAKDWMRKQLKKKHNYNYINL